MEYVAAGARSASASPLHLILRGLENPPHMGYARRLPQSLVSTFAILRTPDLVMAR
jgi:hypothetical protein